MQLSNNLYSNFWRGTGSAKQMLLPGQLNKAEGTVPCIGSHFAPIPLVLFFCLLPSTGAEPLPTAAHCCVPLPELLGISTCCHELEGSPACWAPWLWATDTQGVLTACHRGQATFGMQQCQHAQILHILHARDFTNASFPGPVCTTMFGGLARMPCSAVCHSTRTR